MGGNRTRKVYGLLDIDNKLRYVGCTVDPKRRLSHHYNRSLGRGERAVTDGSWGWMADIQDFASCLVTLEEVDEDDWLPHEAAWILAAVVAGANVQNRIIQIRSGSLAGLYDERKVERLREWV